MFALIVACGGDSNANVGGSGVSIATVTPAGGQTPDSGGSTGAETATTPPSDAPTSVPGSAGTTAEAGPATQTPLPANGSASLSQFTYPVSGACLPQGGQLMPNAPREYRLGIHEGIDFYEVDNCTVIGLGTPVLAAKAGRIVRIDHAFVDPTAAEMNTRLANPNTAEALDSFRGRQIWVDHGEGIVTRYCHLSGVVGELQVNDQVAQGEIIGFVGESGTPGSVSAPGTEIHLHWELRIGGSYLGAGQDPAQVRALYLALFSP